MSAVATDLRDGMSKVLPRPCNRGVNLTHREYSARVDSHQLSGLRLGNLNVGNDVGIDAFFVTRIEAVVP